MNINYEVKVEIDKWDFWEYTITYDNRVVLIEGGFKSEQDARDMAYHRTNQFITRHENRLKSCSE